jgi:hypothetical protein
MPGAAVRSKGLLAAMSLAALSLLGLVGPASAQVPVAAAWLSRELGQMPFRVDYRFTLFPDEPVSGQRTDLGYLQHEAWLSGPIWQDAGNEWTAAGHVRLQDFSTGARLEDGSRSFPDQLWYVSIGGTYRHRFDNGWIGGLNVTVVSPSDKPFDSWDEITLNSTAFLRVPHGERNAWLFLVNYSNTREFLPGIPLPGVAYLYQPSDRFQLVIGVPAALTYTPWDPVTLEVFYAPLTNIRARVTYRLPWAAEVFVAYAWEHETYFLADRARDDDRLFYYDQRVSAGVRFGPWHGFRLELAGGYTFDRFYFEGESFADRHVSRLDIGSGPFVSARVDFRF